MASEQTPELDQVLSVPMSEEVALKRVEDILIQNWLAEFDLKLAALDVRQAASLRKLGIEITDEDEAAAPATGTKLKVSS